MNRATLADGTKVFCLHSPEAIVLDFHVKGYFNHGIHLNDGAVVVDVGANIGIFGFRICQKYPTAKVYAFEPIPAIFEVLTANAKIFGNRYMPLRFGVGKEQTKLVFDYYPNSPALSTAHSKIWDDNPQALATAAISTLKNPPPQLWFTRYLPSFVGRWFSGYMRRNKIKVECEIRPLSEFIEQYKIAEIDLLKIDCEGAELDVILGIDDTSWAKIKQVVIEVFNVEQKLEKIQTILTQKGFHFITEEEDALRNSNLYNIYALKKS